MDVHGGVEVVASGDVWRRCGRTLPKEPLSRAVHRETRSAVGASGPFAGDNERECFEGVAEGDADVADEAEDFGWGRRKWYSGQ